MSASAASADLPPAVASWHDQIEPLSEHASPCRYLLPAKWAALRESALDFCDRLGAQAHALGWTAPELFAVHPEHGTLRIDYCGVMMITGNRAQGVEPNTVVFERGSAYRIKPGQIWRMPVWEFAARRG